MQCASLQPYAVERSLHAQPADATELIGTLFMLVQPKRGCEISRMPFTALEPISG